MVQCDKCNRDFTDEAHLEEHKRWKHPTLLDALPRYGPIIMMLILFFYGSYLSVTLFTSVPPLAIKDVPKDTPPIHLSFTKANGYDTDWNIEGSFKLSNTWTGDPVSDFFRVRDTVFARDINLAMYGEHPVRNAVLRMYALPPGKLFKECHTLSDDEKNTLQGAMLIPFSDQNAYVSPTTEDGLNQNRLSTNRLLDKGDHKVILCMEYTILFNGNEIPRLQQLSEQTIDVVSTYETTSLEYQKRGGLQTTVGIFIALFGSMIANALVLMQVLSKK